jgi:hypothetical protein
VFRLGLEDEERLRSDSGRRSAAEADGTRGLRLADSGRIHLFMQNSLLASGSANVSQSPNACNRAGDTMELSSIVYKILRHGSVLDRDILLATRTDQVIILYQTMPPSGR